MLRTALIAAMIAVPTAVLAVGADDVTVPSPTPTSTTCEAGMIWDAQTRTCIRAQSEVFDDDTRFAAVRELAYAGRGDSAALVLAAMREGNSDRVMTYRGFLARTAGDFEAAMAYYTLALAINPDNILARSYMAQGFVAEGRVAEAEAELAEIRARGGVGTWAEASLVMAIRDGATFNY